MASRPQFLNDGYYDDAINSEVNIELGNSKEFQLHNLKEDIGQNHNLAKTNPKKLKKNDCSF